MTRPASLIKLGYHPTPDKQVELLLSIVQRPPEGHEGIVTILDNFAGEGKIAHSFARHLDGLPYLVELDRGRAETAQATTGARGAAVLNAPAESLKTTGGFSVWIFNPPYSFDAPAHGRAEIHLFHATVASAAKPGTLCILILPQATVADPTFSRDLYRYIERPVAVRFSPEDYATYHQVVVIGYARRTPLLLQDVPLRFAGQGDLLYPSRSLDQTPRLHYTLQNFEPVTEFESSAPDWQALLTAADTVGVRQGKLWRAFTQPKVGMGAFQPLMELESGKAALLTAAGMANSTQIGDEVLKGSTRTYLAVSNRAKDTGDGRVLPQIVERQVYAQVLTLFNVRTGELTVLDSKETPDKFNDYLLTHAAELIANIRAKYPPRYRGDLAPWAGVLARIHSPKRLPGVPDGLLPKQQHVAAAIAGAPGRWHPVIGVQGTGKTVTMIAATLLRNQSQLLRGHGFKCVVLVPGHLVKKWQREIETSLSAFKAKAVIIGEERAWAGGVLERRPLADVQHAFADPGIVFLIVSKETAKNGSPWAGRAGRRTQLFRERILEQSVDGPRSVVKTSRYQVLTCPRCGAVVHDDHGAPLLAFPKDKKGKERHRWRCQALLTTSDWVPARGREKAHFRTERCNTPLFTHGEAAGSYLAYAAYDQAVAAHDWAAWPPRTPEPGRRQLPVGFRREAVAQYIAKHYARRYHLILDELHQYKAEDTDQAYAAVDLMAAALHTVSGTGTPYGGKATTLFYLLYRGIPWFRQLYTYNEVDLFVDHFGLIETIYTSDKPVARSDSSMGYARTADWSMTTREVPGSHPVMAGFMLPYAGFMRLEEMLTGTGVTLPPYEERRVPVDLGIYQGTVAGSLGALKRTACTIKAQGFSAFLQAALGWPDRPEHEVFAFKDHSTAELPRLPPPEDGEWPKVKKVAEMVAAERARDRKSIIYLDQVHRRDTTHLYEQALAARGLTTFVLRADTSGEEREELIDEAARAGVDAMITNGSLVETGLDLVYFCNIFRCQPITSFYKENQQDRRIWRLGQTRPCYIYWVYYSYPGSVQELTVSLMARKLRAALLYNGDLAEGLAATEDNEDDFMQAMLRLLDGAEEPSWEGLPLATPIVLWSPAWSAPFAEWARREHQIVANPRGQIFVRPGAKAVVWPAAATREDVIAWQYRDEVLKAQRAGVTLPLHALDALNVLPPLPTERRLTQVPALPAPAVDDSPLVWPEADTPAPVFSPPPRGVSAPAGPAALRSFGNGILELKAGGETTRLVWLGGDRLSGPPEAVRLATARFSAQLARARPTKKWSATA